MTLLTKYILENGKVKPLNNVIEWAKWLEAHELRVMNTQIGTILISTVFLGIDHNFGRRDNPVLWETMIFARGKPKLDGNTWRFTNKAKARRSHMATADAVQRMFPSLKRTDKEFDTGSLLVQS